MRHLVSRCCATAIAAALAGCAKQDQPPAQENTAAAPPAEQPAPPPAPAPVSLSDLAGKWTMKTMKEGSDSVLLEYQIDASGDSTWTINFPKRKPVKAHVTASGDSIIMDAGPYESALRKGVQVTIHSVGRMQDGKFAGSTIAHYSKGPDSLVTLRFEGTRAP